ncbi:MAG: glycosyltransferase family 4 protein [Thermococcus sp.]|uniref:glycosyltransferase family 4 protein n=1 Tax=Thermococcus sp. TaxID=35749 RepID=UPI001D74B7EB|nr:glycosyltransferase family 4 protein [Thermococcus sp.]MBO8175039.1 glycosyltransferase family 4 protein [Thermococcus sp.]
MRICHIAPGFVPFGREAYAVNDIIMELTSRFVKCGHEAIAINVSESSKRKQRVRYERGVEIFEIPVWDFLLDGNSKSQSMMKEVAYSVKLSRFLKDFIKECDIVHFHVPFPLMLGLEKIVKKGVPIVYTIHNPNIGVKAKGRNLFELSKELNVLKIPRYVNFLSLYAIHLGLEYSTAVIAISKILKSNVIKYFGIKAEKVFYIPNGVDTQRFKPGNYPEVRKLFRIPEGYHVVLNVARIAPYKNQLAIVKAIPWILEETAEVMFVFVGPYDKNSDYKQKIDYFIRKNNLESHVIFTGKISSELLPKVYASADVFVFPSISEGMPMALLEALSSGNAIVASDIPQNREISITGREAIYVNPQNIQEIAESIIILIDDKKLQEKMRKRGRKTAVEHFDWDIISKKVMRVYEEVVGGE